jgi:hypothetical protein
MVSSRADFGSEVEHPNRGEIEVDVSLADVAHHPFAIQCARARSRLNHAADTTHLLPAIGNLADVNVELTKT